MNHIKEGSELLPIKSASGNIRLGKKYKIKKIILSYKRKEIAEVIMDLDSLKNYAFGENSFRNYFGEYTLKPNSINKNITIL